MHCIAEFYLYHASVSAGRTQHDANPHSKHISDIFGK